MQINLSSNISSYFPKVNELPDRQDIAGQGNKVSARSDDQPVLRAGHENVMSLGRIALGQSQLDNWKNRGLEVTDQTLVAAYETLNKAFKVSQDTQGAVGVSINAHQIVADNQSVPEWFTQEHQEYLDASEVPGARDTFARGEYFHIATSSGIASKAIKAYTSA